MTLYTIYKYCISREDDISDVHFLQMPKGAEIIRVGRQEPHIVLWAKIRLPEPTTVRRVINIRGTGHPFTDEIGSYIGTVDVAHLVWHIFDGGEA